MQLKLLYENIKHYLLLVVFILLVNVMIISSLVVSFEANSFLFHVSQDEYKRMYNDFDVVIKSNTGLSLKGTRGENNIYDSSYSKRVSFYNVTLLIETANSSLIVNVFEGTNDDYQTGFNFKTPIQKDQAIITKNLAEKNNINIGDDINIYIGQEINNYEIIDIVDNKGIYTTESIFITGTDITSHYALKNMYNLIMLNIDESENYDEIYNHLKNEYNAYTVINVNDVEHISSMIDTTLDELLIVVALIFVIILIILLNMFFEKTKKQKEYFDIIGKQNYYRTYKLLFYMFLVITSLIISTFVVNLVFVLFANIYSCRSYYDINYLSLLISVTLLIIVYIIKSLFKNKQKNNIRKIYLIVISSINLILLLLTILNISSTGIIFKILLVIFISLLLLEGIFLLIKKVMPFILRMYIYDFNKNNLLINILHITYISIIVILSIILASINIYTEQIENITDIININEVVVTKVPYENDKYDEIKISDNGTLYGTNLNIIISVKSNQYDKYLNYGTLSPEEKQLFDSNEKYIILSKYYENTENLKIGDKVEITINEGKEQFTILKFVNHMFRKMVIVNHSDELFYGYIINDSINKKDIVSDFNLYKYQIVDFSSVIENFSGIYNNVLLIVKYCLVAIIIIILLFSFYISYQEYIYQEDKLKKLKLLGLSNNKMLKINFVKLLYNIIICFGIGIPLSIYILGNIDNVSKLFRTIMYMDYNIFTILISSIFIIICLLVSFVYANIKYKKLNN